MWNADKLGYRGNTGYNRAYEGDELVWEKQGPGPVPVPYDELWYTSTDGNIIIPNHSTTLPPIISNTYIDGKGVIKCSSNITSIGPTGFNNNERLQSITLPDSVTIIESQSTFSSCSNLNLVNLGNGMQSIGIYAFYRCVSLTSIIIPNSVQEILAGAFQANSNLTNITYNGTKAQWRQVSLGAAWHLRVPATVVHCTDGDVAI